MWQIPDTFEVQRPKKSVIPVPTINNEQEKKKLFGVELAKTNQAFQAAQNICGDNTSEALWISTNWLNDPEVIAAKDIYLKSLEQSTSLLDKEETAARLLEMSEEMNLSRTFYVLDGKDRLKALELYAKIRGYLDSKADTSMNFIHNQMVVKFVKPDVKEEKLIKNIDNNDFKSVDNISPLKIKLVGT